MGKDFSRERNDLNMLITVNTITRKVLITSIPRDYYIPAVGYKYKDSLMVMGILGDDVVIKSIESYFGIEIDFKINVYTENLVDIVDKIGGIEFCSDISYRTTHALVQDTYNDNLGKKFYVKKGCQHLNGIQTLTVARERLAFKGENGGDRVRQVNCRKIMISILKKILSTSTLTNYSSILDSFSGFYSGKRVLITGHTGFKGSWLSIWLRELGATVIGVGLDPQIGFLHEVRSGRPGLALDLMEEFRAVLADRVALSLVNLRQVGSCDFRTTESGAVEMKDETRKVILQAWQKKKQEVILHPFLNERVSSGLLPHLQALLLARYLRGDMDAYPPFLLK